MRNLVAAVITGMVFDFNIVLIRFLENLGDLFIFLKKSNYFFFFFWRKTLITKGALSSGSCSVWMHSFVCEKQSGVRGALQG